jgi:hypothetical protein
MLRILPRSDSTHAHGLSGRSNGVGMVIPAARREPRGPDNDFASDRGSPPAAGQSMRTAAVASPI